MSEFQDRERRSGLGELDEQVARERGDFSRYGRPYTQDEAKGDVRYQDQVSHTPQASGTIPIGVSVVATYDSRFVNGQDFIFTAFPAWNITAPPPAALQLQIQYVVPGGYTAVIRNYRYEMEPAVPITYSDLLLDWFVDDRAIVNMSGLMHGQTVTQWVPCFFLAGAGSTVTAQFRAPTGINSVPGDVRNLILEIQGNLLQDLGVPLPFTIGTQRFGAPQQYAKATK